MAPTDPLWCPALQHGHLNQILDGWINRHLVVTRHRIDDQRIAGRIGVGDPHLGGEATNLDRGSVRDGRDRVVTLGA